VSFKMATINTRIQQVLLATDDNEKASFDKWLTDLENGELSSLISDDLMSNIKTTEYGNKSISNIKDLIELQQYLKSQWFIDLGLNSNFNMKRESLNSNETNVGEMILLPYIDDMLQMRREFVNGVNKMYGTNISVELDSSWAYVNETIKEEQEEQEEQEEPKEEPKQETKEGDNNV
jgi:hypothetical protein